jgi:cytochrome c oxidase assembly protein Cox11
MRQNMGEPSKPQHRYTARSRDFVVASLCGGFVVVMAGLICAAVPALSWLLRTTGVGGATEMAASAPPRPSGPLVAVRFDPSVVTGQALRLAGQIWRLARAQNPIGVGFGQVVMIDYAVAEIPDRPRSGQAADTAGQSATTECNCATLQRPSPDKERDGARGEPFDTPALFHANATLGRGFDRAPAAAAVPFDTFHSAEMALKGALAGPTGDL